MVDVLAQGGCTITPISPTTLTATGGVLANGTENVIIQCNCTDDDGMVVNRIRWYDPAGTRLRSSHHVQFDHNIPYFERVNNDDSNIILIIPIFNCSYDGTYTCGKLANDVVALEPPMAAVTLNGKLTQSVICTYIIVAMSCVEFLRV